MYNQDSSMEDFLNSAFRDAKLFLSSKKTFSIEEISENPLLQKALCQVIVNYWNNPKAQENFIILFVELPEDMAFEMLSSISEIINEDSVNISENDKKSWCEKVTQRLSKNKENSEEQMDIASISDYSEALYKILNGEDIDVFNYENDFEDDEEEDEEKDDEYLEEERDYERSHSYAQDYDNYVRDGEDNERNLAVIEKKLFPRERRESPSKNEKVDMNPTSLATLVLSGKQPNNATQLFMLKNKSFAKAYANALSLQTVIAELQSAKYVQERYMSGLTWLDEDIFEHAWQALFNRRNELSPNWSENSKREWKKAIEKQKYSRYKEKLVHDILGWKKSTDIDAEKKTEIVPKKVEDDKPNPYSRISKYYYENGNFEDGAFDEKIDDQGMVLYAKALAVDAYPHWDNPEKDTLELFSEAVRFLEIYPFEMAIQTLVETFEKNKKTLSLEKKKEISYAVLQKLADAGTSNYDDYRETLINAISGYNKMMANKKEEEKSES